MMPFEKCPVFGDELIEKKVTKKNLVSKNSFTTKVVKPISQKFRTFEEGQFLGNMRMWLRGPGFESRRVGFFLALFDSI